MPRALCAGTCTPVYATKSFVVGQANTPWTFGYSSECVSDERQSVATRGQRCLPAQPNIGVCISPALQADRRPDASKVCCARTCPVKLNNMQEPQSWLDRACNAQARVRAYLCFSPAFDRYRCKNRPTNPAKAIVMTA